jgi:hypothetical protein
MDPLFLLAPVFSVSSPGKLFFNVDMGNSFNDEFSFLPISHTELPPTGLFVAIRGDISDRCCLRIISHREDRRHVACASLRAQAWEGEREGCH